MKTSENQRNSYKKYCENNKEKVKQIHHEYYLKHKEYLHQKNLEWIKNNKERFINSVNKSRRKRVEKLREQGVKNAWAVVNYHQEPKYKETKNE